jgi:hypothetical protein
MEEYCVDDDLEQHKAPHVSFNTQKFPFNAKTRIKTCVGIPKMRVNPEIEKPYVAKNNTLGIWCFGQDHKKCTLNKGKPKMRVP